MNTDRSRRAFTVAVAASIAGFLSRTSAAVVASSGHRLTEAECGALEGHTLDASPRLREDIERLVGDRYPRFVEGIADARAIERFDDDLVGEGVRPGSLGTQGSFFVAGRDGALFVALKSGLHGEDIETFGDAARLAPAAHQRWLEFADLDE